MAKQEMRDKTDDHESVQGQGSGSSRVPTISFINYANGGDCHGCCRIDLWHDRDTTDICQERSCYHRNNLVCSLRYNRNRYVQFLPLSFSLRFLALTVSAPFLVYNRNRK